MSPSTSCYAHAPSDGRPSNESNLGDHPHSEIRSECISELSHSHHCRSHISSAASTVCPMYLTYSASVSSHFGVCQPGYGRCCRKCTADMWNTYSHTVEPLYNRHFGTLILVLITEVSSIQRSFNTHTRTQNDVLIIEVSSIQRFVIERSHCTLIPAFLHSYMQ